MSTSLTTTPAGTVRYSNIPGATPNLLHPDGSVSFVACEALARTRVAEGVQNMLGHRYGMALDMALAQAEQQAERIWLSDDDVALMDLRDELARKDSTDPHMSRLYEPDRRALRARIAELEAKVAHIPARAP